MLNCIHHVGIAVRAADEALGFYRDVLGLPVTKDAVLEEQGVRGVLLSAGETEIELLQPLRTGSPVGRFLESRGEGLHHLCFGTDDIEAELKVARERGLPLIDERPRPGLAGMIAFIHPRAACGVLVEFAQPPEPSRQFEPVPANALTVRRFDHLAVAVADREAGVRAFTANFGLAEDTRADLPREQVRLASLPLGAAYVEILEPLGDDGLVADFLRRRGEGLYQFSLAVDDLDRALTGLRGRGVACTAPSEPGSAGRWSLMSPEGTHGVPLQFVEHRS